MLRLEKYEYNIKGEHIIKKNVNVKRKFIASLNTSLKVENSVSLFLIYSFRNGLLLLKHGEI